LELYQQEYDLGRRTLLDLLVAQNDHVAARSQIVTAENDLTFANYRVLDAMGSMVQNVLGSKLTDYTKKVGLSALEIEKKNSNGAVKASPQNTSASTENEITPKVVAHTTKAASSDNKCYKVVASSLNIRSNIEPEKKVVSKMAKSPSIGKYEKDDIVCAETISGIWAKTDKGWVSTTYLAKLD